MGKNVSNMGGGHDFATGEYYIEFHRRLVLEKDAWQQAMDALEQGDHAKARDIMKKHGPQNAHGAIDALVVPNP